MTATAVYEFRMQIRKRSMWIVLAGTVLLLAATSRDLVADALDNPDPQKTMGQIALLANIMLPAGYGCLLADRLIRDIRLGVAPILDTTPAHPAGRLLGKYLGACAAVAVPLAILYFGFAVAYVAVSGRVIGLVWAVAGFAAVMVPALLFVGAFALAVPLLIPAPLFRVLFVGYWFWGNSINPAAMPTLALTLMAPLGGYQIQVFFGYQNTVETWAGPVPGAALNFLRPEPTAATASLAIAVLLSLAALVLTVTHVARTDRKA
ncbi:hypothetical protein WEI85_11620 [Actinomycetes bacterium KLBMP 9797]